MIIENIDSRWGVHFFHRISICYLYFILRLISRDQFLKSDETLKESLDHGSTQRILKTL